MDLKEWSSSSEELNVNRKCCADCKTTKTPLWRGGPAGPKVSEEKGMLEEGRVEETETETETEVEDAGGRGTSGGVFDGPVLWL
ncbi:hypothetical protein JHK85_055268 [Glycine max]|nr:hypothetical protein JHK85_055268 [Glycine max]